MKRSIRAIRAFICFLLGAVGICVVWGLVSTHNTDTQLAEAWAVERQSVINALELYRADKGSYPDYFHELHPDYHTPHDEGVLSWDIMWKTTVYSRTGTTYRLVMPADGEHAVEIQHTATEEGT